MTTRWVAAVIFMAQFGASAWVPTTPLFGRGRSALRPHPVAARRFFGGNDGTLVSRIKMAAGEAEADDSDDSDDSADSDATSDASPDAGADVNTDDVGSENTAGSIYAALNARLKTLESDGK